MKKIYLYVSLLLIENRNFFFFFMYILYILCSINIDTIYCDDKLDYNNTTLTSQRDIPGWGKGWRSLNQSTPPTEGYRPYNPNLIPTNQGFRVELDNREIHPSVVNHIPHSYNETSQNSYLGGGRNRPPFPINTPFSNQESVLLGSIHSDDPSDLIGIIEPTRSEIEYNGNYAGNPEYSGELSLVKSSCCLEKIKNKIRDGYKKLEKWENNMVRRELERRQKEYQLEKSIYYIRGQGWIKPCQLRSLEKAGYTVKDSKVVKLVKVPKYY